MELFEQKIIDSIRDHLLHNQQTLAVAESVTSGLLQLSMSAADKALYFFQGGITAYNLGQKARHLNVNPIQADSCHCVSERTSIEMAQNVCKLFSSDWGIGITGFATPVPESGKKMFAWFAIVHQGNLVASEKIEPSRKTPFDVQLEFCHLTLKKLNELLSANT